MRSSRKTRDDYEKSARYYFSVHISDHLTLDPILTVIPGSGESGKSTIVKQMKIIHQNGYTREELSLYRLTIYKNVLDCAKALIGAMRQFEIEPTDPQNEGFSEFLLEYQVDPDPHKLLDPQVGQAVASLWKDPSIARVMDHQSEFYLMDSAP